MALISTRPLQTLSGIPGTYKTDIDILSTNSVVVDSVVAVNNYSIKWIVTLVDNINSKTNVFEVLVINKFNTTVSHSVNDKIGDHINHSLVVQLNSGNIELIITNNEANNINVSVVRIQSIH